MFVLLALSACLKPSAPLRAGTETPVRVAVILESYDEPAVGPAPDAVRERVAETLTERNIGPVPIDPSATASFAQVRSTEARRTALGTDQGPVLLLECAPRFSAQVNGRYRWTVDVRATIGPDHADARQFTVPVHLLYAHEQEEEALVEAAPLIARELGRLLDDWLAVSELD